MGLSHQSSGTNVLRERFNISADQNQPVIALAGNPNTGKSTVFNALTGLHQHTGNWPGKTVLQAQGVFRHQGIDYRVVDLPGTYSLLANSKEEEVARDFIYFGNPAVTVVVADATCLERNLNLLYQIIEITPRVIICVNLMDEARRKKILVDTDKLQEKLGLPVIPTVARDKLGLDMLKDTVSKIVAGQIQVHPHLVQYDNDIEEAIKQILPKLRQDFGNHYNLRWLALKLLDGENINKLNPQAV